MSEAKLIHADLRETNLKHTYLNSADLSFAQFDKEGLRLARLALTVVSFYFLSFSDVFDPLNLEIETGLLVAKFTHGSNDDVFLLSVSVKVSSLKDIESTRKELENQLGTAVAVFDTEYRKILERFGGQDLKRNYL